MKKIPAKWENNKFQKHSIIVSLCTSLSLSTFSLLPSSKLTCTTCKSIGLFWIIFSLFSLLLLFKTGKSGGNWGTGKGGDGLWLFTKFCLFKKSLSKLSGLMISIIKKNCFKIKKKDREITICGCVEMRAGKGRSWQLHFSSNWLKLSSNIAEKKQKCYFYKF